MSTGSDAGGVAAFASFVGGVSALVPALAWEAGAGFCLPASGSVYRGKSSSGESSVGSAGGTVSTAAATASGAAVASSRLTMPTTASTRIHARRGDSSRVG